MMDRHADSVMPDSENDLILVPFGDHTSRLYGSIHFVSYSAIIESVLGFFGKKILRSLMGRLRKHAYTRVMQKVLSLIGFFSFIPGIF